MTDPDSSAQSAATDSEAPRWKEVAVVLNRESGTIARLGPEKIAEELQAIYASVGIRASVQLAPGSEIVKALTQARDSSAGAVIVGGGDGTVAAAATLMAGQAKPLGILPLGTFNLAARDAGMPLDWEEAALALVDAPVVQSDLLDFSGQQFCCVMVLGFYPALALGRKNWNGNWMVRAWKGAVGVFRNAATFPPLELDLKVDGETRHVRTSMAVLVNNDFEDLFGLIPRRRTLDGGYFTVYISKHRTRWGLFITFLLWLFGRWKLDREMTSVHAAEMTISTRRSRRLPVMRDGEIDKLNLPFTVKINPRALPLLAPRALEDPGDPEEKSDPPSRLMGLPPHG